MMSALLRHGAARRIAGSVLQQTQAAIASPAVAEERRWLVPRRMLFTEKRAPEELTLDIQRKQRELCHAIAEGKRSLNAATDWRTQQKLFDAIAKARRSLAAVTDWCDEDPQEYFRRPKPHQIFLGGIVLFFIVAEAIRKIIMMGLMITVPVALVCATRELKQKEEAKKKREEAKKNRHQ